MAGSASWALMHYRVEQLEKERTEQARLDRSQWEKVGSLQNDVLSLKGEFRVLGSVNESRWREIERRLNQLEQRCR